MTARSASDWLLTVTDHVLTSAAADSSHSRMQESNDRCTSVTCHSTQVCLIPLLERPVTHEVSGFTRPRVNFYSVIASSCYPLGEPS